MTQFFSTPPVVSHAENVNVVTNMGCPSISSGAVVRLVLSGRRNENQGRLSVREVRYIVFHASSEVSLPDSP